jgi:hypothetical protein
LFIAFACQHENYKGAVKIYNGDFGEAIYLTSENVDFDEPMMKPVRLLLIDSILLAFNMNTDPLIHKYNLNTFKKTGECISFGGGPEDLLSIRNMQRSDSTIWLTDTQSKKCLNYLISDLCFKETFQSLNRVSTSEMFKEAWIFPDCRVVSLGFNSAIKRFSFYSPDGTLIQTKGDYPSFGSDLTELEKIEGFASHMAVNYSANRIYVFCLATDLLEIYDLDGELIKMVHGPDHFFPAVQEKRNGDMVRVSSQMDLSRDAYSSPVIINDEIFVLYSGTYFTTESVGYRKDQLLVYDKDGHPLRRYKLSEAVFQIAVDAENKVIYGLSDSPEYHLLGFRY